MAPKKSRAELDRKYFETITAIDKKLETFIEQYDRIKLYGKPERIAEADKELDSLIKEKSQITDNYMADIAESDNPEPTDFAKAEINKNNLGNYD